MLLGFFKSKQKFCLFEKYYDRNEAKSRGKASRTESLTIVSFELVVP